MTKRKKKRGSNIPKGLFITFEGVEGSGKTIQVSLLGRYLKEKGYKVTITREPGGTSVGKNLREILLGKKNDVGKWCELFLYLADRANNIEKIILPSLDNGDIVLSDRFFDSTIAYQGGGRAIDNASMGKLHKLPIFSIKPDKTIFLDLPIDIGLKRIKNFDRIEQETLDFHKRVREKYLEITQKEPKRFLIIDGTKSIEDIHKIITASIEKLIRRVYE